MEDGDRWQDGLSCRYRLLSITPNEYPTECLRGDGCAVAILAAPEYFRRVRVRSRLQEIVKDAGHISLLYPEFHCELDWI